MHKIPIAVEEYSRADCRREKFSGLRQDRILHNMEIWVHGRMAKELTAEDVSRDPKAVVNAYAEVFGLLPEQVKLLTV